MHYLLYNETSPDVSNLRLKKSCTRTLEALSCFSRCQFRCYTFLTLLLDCFMLSLPYFSCCFLYSLFLHEIAFSWLSKSSLKKKKSIYDAKEIKLNSVELWAIFHLVDRAREKKIIHFESIIVTDIWRNGLVSHLMTCIVN